MRRICFLFLLILAVVQQQAIAEIDVSSTPDDQGFAVGPGDEYVVYSGGGAGVDINWLVMANGPFELKVKGFRWARVFGVPVIPNPFNTDWQPASPDFAGHSGSWGIQGSDGGLASTLYLVVKTNQPIKMKRTGKFVGNDKIKFEF